MQLEARIATQGQSQRLVGAKEAAIQLGLSVWTVYAWARAGRIPSIRLGTRVCGVRTRTRRGELTVSGRKIETYLDALRGRDAIKRAIAEEGATPGRPAKLLEAEARLKLAYAKLTGGEIGRLQLIIARENESSPGTPGDRPTSRPCFGPTSSASPDAAGRP